MILPIWVDLTVYIFSDYGTVGNVDTVHGRDSGNLKGAFLFKGLDVLFLLILI